MENNLTQGLVLDSRQIQDMVMQAMKEALKAMPKPVAPSWLDSTIEFYKGHPFISLIMVVAIILLICLIIRELICSYLKTNEILKRLKQLEDRFK